MGRGTSAAARSARTNSKTTGGNKPKSRFKQATKQKKLDNTISLGERARADRLSKLPTSGAKVQDEYMSFVKEQTGIDLSAARDTMFDTRKMFNIDVRKLGRTETDGETNLRKIQAMKTSKFFDVDISENGRYRYAIRVSNKQSKRK